MTSQQKYLLWAIRRQVPVASGVAATIIALTVAIMQFVPASYTATARLLVEATAVSKDARAATDMMTSNAHLQNIESRLLTQTRLAPFVTKAGLDMSVDDFRDALIFKTSSGRDKATTMTISVSSIDAQAATAAANLLADAAIREHRAIRTERAEDALTFFRQEVLDSKTRVDAQLAELRSFKRLNAGTLPEAGQKYLDRRKDVLAQMNAAIQPDGNATVRRRLQSDLNTARAIYSEQHPKVQLIVSKLAQLGANSTIDSDPDAKLAAELEQIDIALAEIPATELALSALNRDYDLAEAQYKAAVERLDAAAIEERITLRAKGDRLSIIEHATLPDMPTGPRQKIILAGGIALAIIAALGTAILRNHLDPYVRRSGDLESRLGLVPYAVIPQMQPI